MRLTLAALCLAALPTLAAAGGAPFDLPRLTFPDPAPPVTQSCTDPVAIGGATCTQGL
ncbi:hypothetical protein IQ03_01833 [Gemmobacter caeni]|jgi:hypothetical protein|uniref:Uncharacterized protein n=1 Tax=Gemmobacter caeni TaxID=589035 RepID=A0A2T6B4Z2_9RHOB|nr:hypothetical protein [Gemmobacter caeni]PTX51117.1 hypothetical protein C8N34_104236 [Gemmobacter caeni]TWJ01117.1 hypothetical protein IQ03_01833 [Gemmobacter caeni]